MSDIAGTPKRYCRTHHHACDCREARMYAVLRGVADDLINSADETAHQAYIDINEMWIELYGSEILSNAPAHEPRKEKHDNT